jgi:hypothetical protein
MSLSWRDQTRCGSTGRLNEMRWRDLPWRLGSNFAAHSPLLAVLTCHLPVIRVRGVQKEDMSEILNDLIRGVS